MLRELDKVLQPPPEFKCPIAQELFHDPVVALDGHSYERSEIERWFQKGKRTSPMTNEVLPEMKLIPNLVLKRLIKDHSEQARLLENTVKLVKSLLDGDIATDTARPWPEKSTDCLPEEHKTSTASSQPAAETETPLVKWTTVLWFSMVLTGVMDRLAGCFQWLASTLGFVLASVHSLFSRTRSVFGSIRDTLTKGIRSAMSACAGTMRAIPSACALIMCTGRSFSQSLFARLSPLFTTARQWLTQEALPKLGRTLLSIPLAMAFAFCDCLQFVQPYFQTACSALQWLACTAVPHQVRTLPSLLSAAFTTVCGWWFRFAPAILNAVTEALRTFSRWLACSAIPSLVRIIASTPRAVRDVPLRARALFRREVLAQTYHASKVYACFALAQVLRLIKLVRVAIKLGPHISQALLDEVTDRPYLVHLVLLVPAAALLLRCCSLFLGPFVDLCCVWTFLLALGVEFAWRVKVERDLDLDSRSQTSMRVARRRDLIVQERAVRKELLKETLPAYFRQELTRAMSRSQ